MPKKYCKKYAKVSKNTSKIDAKNDGKSTRFRNPRNLVFCEGYNVKMLFSHDQGCPKYIKNPSKINVKSQVRKSMQKT